MFLAFFVSIFLLVILYNRYLPCFLIPYNFFYILLDIKQADDSPDRKRNHRLAGKDGNGPLLCVWRDGKYKNTLRFFKKLDSKITTYLSRVSLEVFF